MARAARGKRGSKPGRESIRDKARKAAAEKEKGGGGLETFKDFPKDIEFFKPKKGKGVKGKNHFSIVPYIVSIGNHPYQEAGEPWHECTFWQHKIGAGTDTKRFVCLNKTEQSTKKKCPICEYRASLLKSGQDPALAEELKPKQRQIFNILDHNEEDKGIQVFEISPYQFGFDLDDEDQAQQEDFEGKFYGDSVNGLSILGRFNEGYFDGFKFPEIARIDFEERDDLEDSLVTEEAVDFDVCLRFLTYDELNRQFLELDSGEEQEEEPEEPPKKERKRTAPKKKEATGPSVEDLADLADDLNTVMELDPPMELDGEEDDLKAEIMELTVDISETEELSEESWATLAELGVEPVAEEPDPPKTKRKRAPAKNKEENKCPHGLVFGTDCDTDDLCDGPDGNGCEKWNDCRDEADKITAANKKK